MRYRIALLFYLFIISNLCHGQDWNAVASSGSDTIYIDLTSIKYEDNIAKVWIKHVFNDLETKKKIINEQVESIHKYEYRNGVPKEVLLKWANFKYYLSLEIIDLKNDKSKTLSTIYYTNNGDVLKNFDFEDVTKYSYVVPGSMISIIFEEVSFYVKLKEEK